MSVTERRHYRRSRSLRFYLGIWLAVLGVLVASLLAIASLQVRAVNRQATVENERATSFLLADSLRQSSNDLTNMVRLYVATGEPRYRDYYFEILAIRRGTAPRPVNYGSSFWDRVLSEGKGFVRYGPPQSLAAQMRAADFPVEDLEALQLALSTSDRLTAREEDVMSKVPGASARERSELYTGLVDAYYLAEKARIMAAIAQFVDSVEARSLRDVESARATSRDLLRLEWAAVVALLLAGGAGLLFLSRIAVRPLSTLVRSTRRMWGGAYSERVDIRAVSELERVATAFNEMAEAVETDVAARQAAEREAVEARRSAEQASHAKTAFLAAMSHEIRTPIIGVTGMLEVLARTELSPQQRQMVATAESSAAALLLIIGDILDFSKIEADRLELAPEPISLPSLVESAVDGFVHTASAKGVLLTWSMSDAVAPAVLADPLRVRQILSNLISNALKFTDSGSIELAVEVVDAAGHDGVQTIEISVTDTGVGIAEEQLSRLFDEYVQADASTAHRFGGTGLGLVICRRLARLMGGDIRLESAVGTGTTARLVVPLPVADPADVDANQPSPSSWPALVRPKPDRQAAVEEGSLLLLAEDHPVNRTVFGQQLDLIGFQVDFAVDGEEALARWRTGDYALVLTDLSMPRVDGLELSRRMRADEKATGRERTPVIAFSANVLSGVVDQCRAAGIDDFMPKPTTIPVLAAKLRQWLPHLAWDAEQASAPNMSDAALLDPARLDEVAGGDAEFARQLIADFAASARADFDVLANAVAGRDAARTRRAAHRMKGAAWQVGAMGLAALTERIEAALGEGSADWDQIDASASSLRQSLERLSDLQGELAGMVSPPDGRLAQ